MRCICHWIILLIMGLIPIGAQCLNILVVLPTFPHSYRTFFDNQIKGLIEGGNDLTVISLKSSDDPFSNDLIPHNIESKTYYYHLPEDQREFDIVYVPSPALSHLSFRFIKESKIKGQVVAGFHSEIHPRHKNPIVNYYLPCSAYSGRDLVNIGIDEKKVIVHHCGVKMHRFQYRTPQIRKKGSLIKILTVCRIVKYKGVEDSIRAVAKLIEKGYSVEFTVIGDGQELNHLKEVANELGIDEQVHFLGYQEPATVAGILQESDIFLHPSFTLRGHTEGIPTSVMEAMAVGMPIVSTIHSGIPELVTDGKEGFLVEEHDIDGLVEKLSYLIKNPHTWKKMSRAGRRVIEEEFNEDKQNQRLCILFDKLYTTNLPVSVTEEQPIKQKPKIAQKRTSAKKLSKLSKKRKSSKYLKRKHKIKKNSKSLRKS